MCLLCGTAGKTLQLYELNDEYPELAGDFLDIWGIDIFDDIQSGAIKPRIAYQYVERLYRKPESYYRARLYDELSKEPETPEREAEMDKLRHVGWTVDSYKLANIEDRLASIDLMMQSFGGVEDIEPIPPSHRPDIHLLTQRAKDPQEVDYANLRKSLRAMGAL